VLVEGMSEVDEARLVDAGGGRRPRREQDDDDREDGSPHSHLHMPADGPAHDATVPGREPGREAVFRCILLLLR
jgi:hypothetical protein